MERKTKFFAITVVLVAVLSVIGASMSVSGKASPQQANSFLYSWNADGTVSKINLRDNNVVGEARAVGFGFGGQWANHYFDGRTAWTLSGSNVIGVDVKSLEIAHSIDISPLNTVGSKPWWPGWAAGSQYTQITPDLSRVYHVNSMRDEIVEIDVATDTILARIPIGNIPGDASSHTDDGRVWPCDNAITPDGKLIVIANLHDPYYNPSSVGSISFMDIDPSSPTYRKEIKRINSSGFLIMDTVSPDGKYTEVQFGTKGAYIVDMTTQEIVKEVAGAFGSCNEYTKDGAYSYNTGGTTLNVIRMSDLTLVKQVNVGGPVGCVMTWSTDGKYAYYPHRAQGKISVIDTSTHTVVGKIDVPNGPGTIMVSPPMRYPAVTYG